MSDLNQLYLAYLVTLRAAVPTGDTSTLLAKDLPVVRAAHPTAVELDDYNTLMSIHLGYVSGSSLLFDPDVFDLGFFDSE